MDMQSVSRLRAVILNALSDRTSPQSEQELFDELLVHKSRLVKLFEVGPSKQEEITEAKSGKMVINGKSTAINEDFARQTLFLAQVLECSERYVAGVLYNIMSENPNIGSLQAVEATIAEFHTRRRHLADSLRFIAEAAEVGDTQQGASVLYQRIAQFFRMELVPGAQTTQGAITLPSMTFQQMIHMGDMINRAQNAKQSARTATAINQGSITLGYDILNARYDSLKYERRTLAHVLCIISRLGQSSPYDIKRMVDWLSTNPNHVMTYYVLTSTLAAFDPVHPRSYGGMQRRNLAMNDVNLTYMTNKLAPDTEWKDSSLKAVIILKWALFLTETRHRDPNLEHRAGFKTEELETQVWNAVQGDAFKYLALAIIQLERKRGSSPPTSFANSLKLTPEQESSRELPSDEFRTFVLESFETLIRSTIAHASSELRKIKQRQEDFVLANVRSRNVSNRFASQQQGRTAATANPRNDIAIFYALIGLLYSALPVERGLQFWGSVPRNTESRPLSFLEITEIQTGKLPAFLQWAVWSTQVHDIDMSMALYDMLAGLSKGQQCSELSYNFMARGGGEVNPGTTHTASSTAGPAVSWGIIFNLLNSWATPAATARVQPQPVALGSSGFAFSTQSWQSQAPAPAPQAAQQISIGPKEVLLAQSFLRLLSAVVTHSVAVRGAIVNQAQFRAIPTLVSLIPLGVPLELKGAVFETLAAFCQPGAGARGVDICKAVWTLMEKFEVINVRVAPSAPFGGGLPVVKGVEVELEEVEALYRMYPATIPFLKLLSTLIHTPKRVLLKDRIADAEPINTTPEGLGSPYRLPGLAPYVSFIVDNVFAKISTREYLQPSDRWQTNDLCLSFIERALASFDLESLVSNVEDGQLTIESLMPLLVHPGYDIMKRLLTNSPLQASILSYIVDGVEGFEKNFAEEEPYFRSTIIRVLRIVHRVLEVQNIFLDVLVPLLSEFDSAPIIGTVHTRSSFTRFDQSLFFGNKYIPALACYVAYPAHPELVLLSVQIITVLSASQTSSSLITLIEQSVDSERILNGFKQILDTESLEDVDAVEVLVEQATGAGAPDRDSQSLPFDQAIRVAALDLFIQDTSSEKSYPNLSHFLLFGRTNIDQIQDPHALGASRTCIHVILDLVNAGIPRLGEDGASDDEEDVSSSQDSPLFMTLPAVAERLYRIVHQLCVHPKTSDLTMRYLRTRENFFARQLASIPSQVPTVASEPSVEVLYNDGSRIISSVSALTSFLRLRSWIFDLAALDLHVLTSKGHLKGVTELLEILFGSNSAIHDMNSWEHNALQPFREIGQSHLRIIEFFQSLNFEWQNSLTVEPTNLQLLGKLNLLSCVRAGPNGCEIIDKTALLAMLTSASRSLHSQGAIVTPAQSDQLSSEITYILESCTIENHRREVVHAVASGHDAWRRLLDMILTKCFTRLPHERRENMLFDLLHVLPPVIRSAETHETTAILLSEVVLSSITKLREDRKHQIVIQSASGDAEAGALPAERLYGILRNLLDCILDSNRIELVRGNLYAALINYVHLISSVSAGEDLVNHEAPSLSLSMSTAKEDFLFNNDSESNVSLAQTGHSQVSSLEKGSLRLMKTDVERLVATIARDAIDGSEVWKTVAFMLLDSLVQLSRLEKQHVVLAALARHGILPNFVRGLKDSDIRLQSVLKPDPDDLNPLYVYEAKMSMFIRMSQTRTGAERLLEAQLLPILSQCDYVDARPEADSSFMDNDSFLPSAIQRYHQLFAPALQLVDGMLATLGTKHATVAEQALDFLSSHRDTIVILLKADTTYLPLAAVEEVHLIISLCASVLHLVPKSELTSSGSGFGGIHAAILGLSTQILAEGRWAQKVQPQTDAELFSASVFSRGQRTHTKFDVTVKEKSRLLRKTVITYIGTASEFTEPEIVVVLSPVTMTPRNISEDHGSRFHSTIPTVGNAIEALGDLCNELSDTLQQIAHLSAEIASRDHIGVDNVEEIVNEPDVGFLRNLDIHQKRSLICREFEINKRAAQDDAKTLLGTMEMLLLLLWRHLAHYAEGLYVPANSTAQLKSSTRFQTAPDPDTFRAEVAKRLVPTLQRLCSLDLHYELLGNDWRANQGYVDIMCRRLKDTVGLSNANSSAED